MNIVYFFIVLFICVFYFLFGMFIMFSMYEKERKYDKQNKWHDYENNKKDVPIDDSLKLCLINNYDSRFFIEYYIFARYVNEKWVDKNGHELSEMFIPIMWTDICYRYM